MRLTQMAPELTPAQVVELQRCKADYAYFLNRYGWIENATDKSWIRFSMWAAQCQVLADFQSNRQVLILKARQLGLTWLVLGYILAEMLFAPITIALFFSRGQTEAKDLLTRLKGMYSRLPAWMKEAEPIIDNTEEWRLPTGSRAQSFPTTGGRSYTASIVVVDEADFIKDLNAVMNAVKPTTDAGGKMFLISTVDKGKPASPFKQMYRSAKADRTGWLPVFLPWNARPDRDDAWYAAQKADVFARTGAHDDLHQEYPETDTEALAPRTLDKRIPAPWIEKCYVEMRPIEDVNAPSVPRLEIYVKPHRFGEYVIGADPAEGNPTSDDSALTVMDSKTGEEVAALAGKIEMSVFADYIDQVGRYYNDAAVMVERNNHGHTVLQCLETNSALVRLAGRDDRAGWLSSSLGKTILYNETTDAFRNQNTTLHSFASYTQLASIEGSTLRAPEGEHDDRADSYALAHVARTANEVQKEAGVW